MSRGTRLMSVTSWSEPCQHLLATEPAAAWVLQRLGLMGVGLEVDDRVRGEIAADTANRTLVLSPDLLVDWKRAHWRITRGCLFLEGGATWAPEFAVKPPPVPAPPRPVTFGHGHASVTYLPVRRPW